MKSLLGFKQSLAQLLVVLLTLQSLPVSASVQFNIPPPVNLPPQVNAGFDKIISTSRATLNGTVTDDGKPNGTLITQWEKVDGPGIVAFRHPELLTTEVLFSEVGQYILRLTANDSQMSSFDEISVEFSLENKPPQVSAGADQNISRWNPSTILNGSVTDDGLIRALTYQWSGPATFTNPNSLTTEVKFPGPGKYILQLTANDGELSASDEVEVNVDCSSSAEPLDVMLVVDTSSSMLKNPDGSGWAAADDAKVVAKTFLEYLRAGIDQAGLIQFNGAGILNSSLTDDFNSVKLKVSALQSNANASYVYGGLKLAQEELLGLRHNSAARKIILLLTDGQFIYENAIPDQIKSQGTHIIGVGLGWDGRPVPGWNGNPKDVLQKISSETYFRSYGDPVIPTVLKIIQSITENQCLLNKPPVVSITGSSRVYLLGNLSLVGTAIDTSPMTFSWTKESGSGSVTFSNEKSLNTSVGFSQEGEYVLKLSANDGQWTSYARLSVVVIDSTKTNSPPEVSAGSDQTISIHRNLLENSRSKLPDLHYFY